MKLLVEDLYWDYFIDVLNEEQEFSLLFTFGAELEYKGSGSILVRNTIENMGDSMIILDQIAPEPGTLSFLGLGGLVIACKRKRKK